MKIASARATMETAENRNQFFLIEQRLAESTQMVQLRYMKIPDECYQTVAALWDEKARWTFTPAQVETILSLYPRDRIVLATIGNTVDPTARDCMLDVLAHFFLGCSWPGYGDSVDMDRFVSLLQHQFQQGGF